MISEDATLIVVDVQEKLVPSINDSASMILNTKKSILSAKILGMPIMFTEQYPKGLGHTITEIRDELEGVPGFEKTTFSCCGSPDFMKYLKGKHVLLTGIEAHICVYQTACELLEHGFEVTVIEDAVSSRKKTDHQRALRNLEKKGVFISTFECLFMNLVKDAKHPSFKEISTVLKL